MSKKVKVLKNKILGFMIFFSKIPKSKMNEKSGFFFVKKCTHSAYFYHILSYINFVSFAVIHIPIHMFHNMNIFNARKVQHSKVINKNILDKKCKNDPNYQKVDQMAIFHFLRDVFLLINYECCIFLHWVRSYYET